MALFKNTPTTLNTMSTGVNTSLQNIHWGTTLNSTYVNSVYTPISTSRVFYNSSTKSVEISVDNKLLIEVAQTGDVKWHSDVNIDAAAEALSKSLYIGLEHAVGITLQIKNNIRNDIFEEIIQIAESEGPLDAAKLTFILKSSKIMDKLKHKY